MAEAPSEMGAMAKGGMHDEERALAQARDDRAVEVLKRLISKLPKDMVTGPPPEAVMQNFSVGLYKDWIDIAEKAVNSQRRQASTEEAEDNEAEDDEAPPSKEFTDASTLYHNKVARFHQTVDETYEWITDGQFETRSVNIVTKQYRKLDFQLSAMQVAWLALRNVIQREAVGIL